MTRRHALSCGIAAATAAALRPTRLLAAPAEFKSMTGDVKPVSRDEYLLRIDKARRLMAKHGIGALLIEPGASMVYFTGVHWWRSERLTAVYCRATATSPSSRRTSRRPRSAKAWKCRPNCACGTRTRIRSQTVAGILADRKVRDPVGIEETVRYFAIDGLMRAMPDVAIMSGAAIVRGCRMVKTPTEIRLMQKASDITIAAYRYAAPRIEKGMKPADIGALMKAAHEGYGAEHEFALILLGEASAYPHGSDKPQSVREGEVVLMDCGCSVQGYQSDISRTFVFGAAPSAEQRKVWEQMRQGQQIAIETARVGVAAGAVDDAVRVQYEKWGYGPGYKLPGTSHRTGHGIGLDGHEPVNLVHGEATPLAEGMCFSNEPGIYLPGKFGVRLEDCFHMGEKEPIWFSKPPESIDKPFA
jgi:Xaa-Pro dipeptidase